MTAREDFQTLKNVLFGPENVMLQELRRLVARHDARIGSQERLIESIAAILAEALKRAGAQNRDGLALALAPVIAESIRLEIQEPQSGMADALSPIAGRLMASGFRNLADETNQRLESALTGRYVRLKLKSLSTGRPYKELLLQEKGAFRVQGIILIDTENGVLLDRLPAPEAYSQQVTADEDGAELSLLLAAINGTAADAPGSASKLYWRSAGSLALAVRADGPADRRLVRTIDEAISETLEIYGPSIQSPYREEAARAQREALLRLAERLPEPQDGSRRTPVLLYALLVALLAALLGWAGWTGLERIEAHRIYRAAVGAVQSNPRAAGYPVTVAYDSARPAITVSGLAPTPAVKEELENAIKAKVPGVPLESRLIALPGAEGQSLAPLLARLDNLDRTQGQMLARLDSLDQAGGQSAARMGKLEQALSQPAVGAAGPDRALSQVIVRLDALDRAQRQAAERLEKLDQARGQAVSQVRQPAAADQAQNMAPARLESLERAQSQTAARLDNLDQGRSAILARLDELDRGRAQLTSLAEKRAAASAAPAEALSPEHNLAAWAARNAIFFAEGVEFRDPAAVRKQLSELKDLLTGAAARLRLIGYTDPLGDPQNNSRLALERAKAIASELDRLGVPAGRLILVGRANERLIASDQGPTSANRRVEFQVAFADE